MPHNAQEIRQRRTPEATDGKGGSHQAINPSLVGRGLGIFACRAEFDRAHDDPWLDVHRLSAALGAAHNPGALPAIT